MGLLFKKKIISQNNILDFFSLSFAQGIVIISGLLITIIWTNFVSQKIYGQYKYILSFLSLVGVFSLTGLGISANISAAKNKLGNFTKLVKYKFFASFVSMVILIVLGFLLDKGDKFLFYSFLIVAVLYPLYNLNIVKPWLMGIRQFKKVALIEILQSVNTLLFFILIIIVLKIKVLFILVLPPILSGLLINIFFTRYAYKTFINKEDKANIKKDNTIVNYGIHSSIANLIAMFASIDNILIAHFLSFKEVAIFSVARVFPNHIKMLFGILNKMFFPYFSHFDTLNELWKWFKKKFFIFILIFIVIGITGFFMIQWLVPLLFSKKYTVASDYGKWLFLVLSLLAPTSFFNSAIQSKMKKKYIYWVNIFQNANLIFLLLILLPRFKLWGGVYSISLKNILSALFFIIYFKYEIAKELKRN